MNHSSQVCLALPNDSPPVVHDFSLHLPGSSLRRSVRSHLLQVGIFFLCCRHQKTPKQWPDILLPSSILIDPLGWSRAGGGVHHLQSSGALWSAVLWARASRGDAAAWGWCGNLTACQGWPSPRSLQLLASKRACESAHASSQRWLVPSTKAAGAGTGIAVRNRAGLGGTARTASVFWCWHGERKGR